VHPIRQGDEARLGCENGIRPPGASAAGPLRDGTSGQAAHATRCARVLVLVLTHNGGRYLGPLAASLACSTYRDFDLWIIDNASTCASTRQILSDFADRRVAKVLRHPENLRFAAGYNRVLRPLVEEHAYDFVFILNDDVEVGADCLRLLVEYLDAVPGAFCVAPTMTDLGRPHRVVTVGGRMSRLNGRGRSILGGRHVDRVRGLAPFPSRCVAAFAMLVRVQHLQTLGVFDERYHHYFEDTDLCFRARRAGLTVAVVPGAVVAHQIGGSEQWLQDGEKFYYYVRNRWFFLERYGWPLVWRLGFFLTPRLLWSIARDAGLRTAYRDALRDALRGRGGARRPEERPPSLERRP